MALLACQLPPSSDPNPLFPSSNSSAIQCTPSEPTSSLPPDAYILSPLHETFEALLRARCSTEACSSMAHRFELSRSSALPNIVTNFLLHCGPTHGSFFSPPVWDTIITGSFCAAQLSPTPFRGFSPLTTLLLNPEYDNSSKTHPRLPQGGFATFLDVLRFINGCKWFIMTIGHPLFYQSTLAFQGLTFLESAMITQNLAARWQEPTIRTAPASYQVLELVHNLFAHLSATASNLPPSCLVPVTVTSPNSCPTFAISPKIQDATLTIDLGAALLHWKSACTSVVTGLCGASSSLASLLQAAQPVSLSHYLFRSSKKRNLHTDTQPPKDSRDGRPIDREKRSADREKKPFDRERAKSKKKSKADEGKAILQPVGTYSIQDLVKLKTEGKITAPRLPQMKGLMNRNGASLCLPFLLGGQCDSSTPCGYHLQANSATHLPGESKADYTSFHEWLTTHKDFFSLTAVASSNSKLAP